MTAGICYVAHKNYKDHLRLSSMPACFVWCKNTEWVTRFGQHHF